MPDFVVLVLAMLATGIVGGVLAGLLGVGGGIVVVPVLEYVLELVGVPADIRMHIAVATSLAVIVPTSISSARSHHRRNAVDIGLVRRWGIWMLAGALAGTVIASQVSGNVLSIVFGVVAFLVAVKMALPLDNVRLSSEVPRHLWTGLIPAGIGSVSAMMGIGGGTFSVPALTLMGTAIHRAVGTSALFGLLISIPGTIGFMVAGWGHADLPTGNVGFVSLIGFALIAPASVLAAPIGARIAHGLSRRILSLFFGLFLLLVSARMFLRVVYPLHG